MARDIGELVFLRQLAPRYAVPVPEREEQLEHLKIAVVDCSPEALNMLYRQLWIL